MNQGKVPSTTRRNLAFLLLAAVAAIWGGTFVLVKSALAQASPLLFNLLRMVLAAAVLLATNGRRLRRLPPSTWAAGAIAGSLLGAGYQLQTAGLARTSAIKSAFLTGLIVVLVPLLSFARVFRGPTARPPRPAVLGGTAIAFAGLFLLATPPGTPLHALPSALSLGDLLTLGCALAFAGHLLALSRLSSIPADQLAPLQIAFAALFMLLTLPLGGTPHLHWTRELALALTITAVFATALAFTVQTWAQQHLSATTTALLLTLEPVFALLFSLLFLGERLSLRSALGAGLILLGIALTELLAPGKLPPEPL